MNPDDVVEMYPDLFVNRNGMVRHLSAWGRMHDWYQGVLNTGKNKHYFVVVHRGKVHYVARLVALAFVDNPNNFRFVNHKNGNQFDNRECNLEWTIRSSNLSQKRTGIRWCRRRLRWYAWYNTRVKKKWLNLGAYNSYDEACQAQQDYIDNLKNNNAYLPDTDEQLAILHNNE